jgi:hypothetical protein
MKINRRLKEFIEFVYPVSNNFNLTYVYQAHINNKEEDHTNKN